MVSLSPLIRIILRMLGGVLVGYGYSEGAINDIVTDPELVGLLCWVAAESWYIFAKKFGWKT